MNTNMYNTTECHDNVHPLNDTDESSHDMSNRRRKKRQRNDISSHHNESHYTRGFASSDKATPSETATNTRQHPGGSILDLTIIGNRCVLHRNDDIAEQLDQGNHLIDLLLKTNHDNGHQSYPRHEQYDGILDSDDMDDVCNYQHDEVVHTGNDCAVGRLREDVWEDIIHPSLEETDSINYCSSKQSEDAPTRIHLLVDRHDARTLLDDALIYQGSLQIHGENCHNLDHDLTNDEMKLIDIERFGDLPLEYEGSEVADGNLNGGDEDKVFSGDFYNIDNSVKMPAFDDGIEIDTATSKKERFELEEKEQALLPVGMTIPKTRREYDIILMTAKKSNESPQFEVLLKVKQTKNPNFSFLDADCKLFPFYCWKRDGNDEMGSIIKRSSTKYNAQMGISGDSMNLLDMYGSSSDDDSDADAEDCKDVEALSTSKCGGGANNNEKNDEQRADRLKRAKMLRHHFANR